MGARNERRRSVARPKRALVAPRSDGCNAAAMLLAAILEFTRNLSPGQLEQAQMLMLESTESAATQAVTVDIKTGRRSVADYLLSPLMKTAEDSLHER